MPITVNAPTVRTVVLDIEGADETVWVKIRPPNFKTHEHREKILSRRSYRFEDGSVEVDINLLEVWRLEIWLTYQDTNLEVQFTDEDGNVTETISFPERGKVSERQFMNLLGKLPFEIVAAWHKAVLEVVPEWGVPFV